MKDSRKLFRLFKGVNEVSKILAMLDKPSPSFDAIDFILAIGVRIGFFFYWLFDNLLILAKMKLFSKPAKSFLKPSMFAWWCALTCNLLLSIKKLSKLKANRKSIKMRRGTDERTKDIIKDELKGKNI